VTTALNCCTEIQPMQRDFSGQGSRLAGISFHTIEATLENFMPYFYVNKNKQANGDNEVHRSDEVNCPNPALSQNRVDLGWHLGCQGAVQAAKNLGYKANGCYYCANECHTT